MMGMDAAVILAVKSATRRDHRKGGHGSLLCPPVDGDKMNPNPDDAECLMFLLLIVPFIALAAYIEATKKPEIEQTMVPLRVALEIVKVGKPVVEPTEVKSLEVKPVKVKKEILTDKVVIKDCIESLRSLGWNATDSKATVNKIARGEAYHNVTDLLREVFKHGSK